MKSGRPLLAVVFLSFAVRLQATSLLLGATQTGWYNQNGGSNGGTANQNYITGWVTPAEFRSFFIFDLTGLAGSIAGAQLQLFNPSVNSPGHTLDGYQSPDASETLTLFDVSTSVATLGNGSGGVAAFNDLGSGTSFGSISVSAADDGTLVTININASGLAAMNSASGLFAIGGTLTTLSKATGINEVVFGNTFASDTRQLLLTTIDSTAAPEPATGLLLGGAVLVLVGVSRFPKRV